MSLQSEVLTGTSQDRRLKMSSLPAVYGISWLQGKYRLVGLPDDAVIVGFFHDYHHDELGIYIWSSTFQVVERGQMLDRIYLTFQAL